MASGNNLLHSQVLELEDPRVEDLIQKLEQTCERLRVDKSIISMQGDETSSAYIPLRIREIIQETLSPNSWNPSLFANSLSQENGKLLKELDKAQALLSESRKDCHDISIKYLAVSEKVDKLLNLEKAVEVSEVERKQLLDEIANLKQTLESKEKAHNLHIRAYQDGHDRQEDQIAMLEARFLQYQEKYLEMDKILKEKQLTVEETDGSVAVEDESTESHVTTSIKQQQQRTAELAGNNQKLRKQLHESQETNQRLMKDVHQLTSRWKESQAKLEERERVWQEILENRTNVSMEAHQTNLKTSLRGVANIKDQFTTDTAAVQRELATAQDEFKILSEQVSSRVEAETSELRNINEILMLELQQKEEELNKISKEMSDLSVKYEALKTKDELTMEGLEKQVANLSKELKESQKACEKKIQRINSLEFSKTEVECGKNDITAQLMVTQVDLSQLNKDKDTLKSCIESIVKVFSPLDEQLSDPTHQHQQKFPLQPKLYDTPEDVERVRDWAISVVKCGVDTKDKTIKDLRVEMTNLEQEVKSRVSRLNEMDEEAKAHSASSKTLEEELIACKNDLQEFTRVRNELEKELEDANSKKMEAEHALSQGMARLNAVVAEKDKMQVGNFTLQDTVSKMKFELEKVKDEMQMQEMELTSKHNNTKKLELQFKSVEDESKSLRDRITEMEATKQRLDREISQQNISIASLQMEKENLQLEIKSVRDSETDAVTTLEELKVINKNLESEKRQLIKSLQEVTDRKVRLDRENVALEKWKIEKEDELQRVKGANTQLTEQVGRLDKSLNSTEHLHSEVQSERDCLKTEVAALNEALGKTKHTLAEVQIQRGKLNNIITKMAQEKGDLIRDKVSVTAEVTKVEGNLKLCEERLVSLQVVKERLEKKLEEVGNRVITLESNRNDLEKNILALQEEKHKIVSEKDKILRRKEEEAHHLLTLKEQELQNVLMQAKAVESELQAAVQKEKSVSHKKLQEVKEVYDQEITLLGERHQGEVAALKEEIASISKTQKTEAARLIREKQFIAQQLEEEKSLFTKRYEKLQQIFEGKCEEARTQYEKSSHLTTELKSQLETSNLNARRLESELSVAERRTQNLQNKLDEVKKETSFQVDSLKDKLQEVSQASSHVESSYNDSLMTIKKLEGQRATLQRQANEVQKQLEVAMKEKGDLQTSCHGFKEAINSMERDLARINEIVANLQGKLKQSEEARSLSEKDASSAHKTLTKVENLHAKLISDHAALQASLTASEQRKTVLQLDLNTVQDKMANIAKQKDELMTNHAVMENKLKVATKVSELKEREIVSLRQRATSLEQERNELSSNLAKVQDCLRLQGHTDAAAKSELQSQVSELKTIRDSLKEEINSLKIALTAAQNEAREVDMKFNITCGQASNISADLKKSDDLRRELESKYMELLGILNGVLGVEIHSERNSQEGIQPSVSFKKDVSQAESGVGDSLFSSPQTSFLGGFQDSFVRSPSNVTTNVRIDTKSVRDAILELQKRLSLSESSKEEALLSVANLEKKINRLEDEKASLEARLRSLRSSLTSLQENFDRLSKLQDVAEVTSNVQKKTINVLGENNKQLEFEVDALRKQVDTYAMEKEEKDKKLNMMTSAQVGCEMECKEHEIHALELEMEVKQRKEVISKQNALISELHSSKETRDAEIIRLEQKLATSQQSFKEAENRIKNARENKTIMSKGKEIKLYEKIQQLEEDLQCAQNQKLSLNRKVEDLSKMLKEMKKERECMENRLCELAQNQLESDVVKEQLQDTIQKLERSNSSGVKNQMELESKLKIMEKKMKEKEDANRKMEARMMTLIQDKELLSSRIKEIEEDMETAVKGKQIANELCSSLESEKASLQREVQAIRDENLQLRGELREANFQSQRLDMLMTNQQKQKSELDESLINSSRQNLTLMKTLRDVRAGAAEREKESSERMENLSLQVDQLQGDLKVKQVEWLGQQQSYRKTIKDLEAKVQLLESKLDDHKHKKIEFLEKAEEYERSIQNLRSSFLGPPLGQSARGMDSDLPYSSSPIRSEGTGHTLFPSSPISGHTPVKEGGGTLPNYSWSSSPNII